MFLFRCFDATELLATVHRLRDFVVEKRVKLVVIDSVAFCFRTQLQPLWGVCVDVLSMIYEHFCTPQSVFIRDQSCVAFLNEWSVGHRFMIRHGMI